jgi:hypothetical protein
MSEFLDKLKGGDLRSLGNVGEVVMDVAKDESLFEEIFNGMLSDDALIRMRSADVIEKVSRLHPQYLQAYKKRLIEEVSKIEQQEVRWHVAQLFSRLELEVEEELAAVFCLLTHWLENSQSKIVQVNSLQTLADLAQKHTKLRLTVIYQIEQAMANGSPALVSRGKKLIRKLS